MRRTKHHAGLWKCQSCPAGFLVRIDLESSGGDYLMAPKRLTVMTKRDSVKRWKPISGGYLHYHNSRRDWFPTEEVPLPPKPKDEQEHVAPCTEVT